MASYITPTSGQQLPDIQTDSTSPPNGSPAIPATSFAGPLLSGNVQHSDGTGNLAGVGGTAGTANRGYVEMGQSCVVTQATNTGTAGQFACPIVIPAQSQITGMKIMITTAFTGGVATFGVGSSASATAFTTATGVTGAALGLITIVPGTVSAQIANWDNVGNQDVQVVIQSGNTGSGVGTLHVTYIQGINLAS